MLKIGVDMDDVLEELTVTWLDYLNKKYDKNYSIEQINCWHAFNNLFFEVSQDKLYEPLNTEEFWKQVPVREDAIEYLTKLSRSSYYKLFLVTNSSYKSLQYKIPLIIEKYFPMFNRDNMIITARKDLIDLDILIDDCAENLEKGNYAKILFDREWNQNSKLHYRAHNWQEVYEYIQEIDEHLRCLM